MAQQDNSFQQPALKRARNNDGGDSDEESDADLFKDEENVDEPELKSDMVKLEIEMPISKQEIETKAE
jgi:hypothetical protein